MQKNAASQKWVVFAFNETDNTAKTGDAAQITANIRIDGGEANAVDDTNPTELEDGYYVFDIAQAETNGDYLLICPASSTSNIQVIGCPAAVWTTPPYFSSMGIESDGDVHADVKQILGVAQSVTDLKDFADTGYDPSTHKVQGVVLTDGCTSNSDMRGTDDAALASVLGSAVGADISADIAAVKSDTGAILTDTGTTLDTLIKDIPTNAELATALTTYDAPTKAEMDAAFSTTNGKIDTIDTNVDSILTDTGTTLEGHLTDIKGTGFAKDTDSLIDLAHIGADSDTLETLSDQIDGIDVSGVADAVWDESTTGHTNAGTFGEQLKTDIDAILTDTKSLNDDAISELTQGIPTATPTVRTALMLLYMIARNKLTVTSTELGIYNDAGTKIAKKTLADDGTTFTESEAASGA